MSDLILRVDPVDRKRSDRLATTAADAVAGLLAAVAQRRQLAPAADLGVLTDFLSMLQEAGLAAARRFLQANGVQVSGPDEHGSTEP